jgi:hypothetical protein
MEGFLYNWSWLTGHRYGSRNFQVALSKFALLHFLNSRKDTVSGMGATKAVIGNCTPLTHSLFVSDIPRR